MLEITKEDSETIQKVKGALKSGKLDKEEYIYYDNLCYDFGQKENWANMLLAASISISLYRFSYYAWLQKGIAHQQKKEYEKALESYDCSIALKRFDANAWYNKSLIYLEMKDKKNALIHLRKALMIDKSYKEILLDDEEVIEFYGDDSEFHNLLNSI